MIGLGEEGNNSDAGVAADNGDLLAHRIGALDLRDEARGTYNVEGGDTKEALRVIDTLGPKDLFYRFVRILWPRPNKPKYDRVDVPRR